MTMNVDVHPLADGAALQEWQRAAQSARAPIFYSSSFLASAATSPLLPCDSPSLVLLRDGDAVLAGTAVFRQPQIDPISHLRPLYDTLPGLCASSGLLGHCWHCYDSRIVGADCRPEHARALVDVLRRLARSAAVDYVGLVNVSDPFTLEAMAGAGALPIYMVDRYVMDLANIKSFDDYDALLHPDQKRELGRQYRRYQESTATLAIESTPFDDLDEVLQLLRRTAARYDAEFYYPEAATKQLLLDLGGALRLISVRCADERVGVIVCFVDPPILHIWAAGVRYDRTVFSPYAVGIAEAIRFAISSGMTWIEGGRGNGKVKRKQGFSPRRLYACLQRVDAGDA